MSIVARQIDFLIVGGGIAGRLIQLELESRGQSTLVYDQANNNRSSAVAAGLANPLVGKYFTVGWRVPEFFSDLRSFYEDIENRLDASFFRPCEMKRIIATPGEQNIWLSKQSKPKYEAICSFAHEDITGMATPYGVISVHQGGELKTEDFMNACAAKLPTMDEVFNHRELDLDTSRYGDISFKGIVFSEGYEVINNPLFRDLVKLIPTKGELLEIETDLDFRGEIYLGGVFIQHRHNKVWRVGSTYARDDLSLNPTEEKKQDMVTKLDRVIRVPYRVIKHLTGTRPATSDRRPLLGVHPKYPNAYIFNGMGSKAVSMAPVLSQEMVDFMLSRSPILPEANITRFDEKMDQPIA